MRRYSIIGSLLVVSLLWAVPSLALERQSTLRAVTPASDDSKAIQPALRPKPINGLSAINNLPLIPLADLKVGTRPVGNPENPAGSGEFPTQFMEETGLSEESLAQKHLYVPFRWRTKMAGIKNVEWQVSRSPVAADLKNWQYPAGLLARGRSTKMPPAPDRDAYFVIDFSPVYDLPPGYTYPRPLPPRKPGFKPAAPTVTEKGLNPLQPPQQRLKQITSATPATQLQYLNKAARFGQAMSQMVKRRTYYVRLVLLNGAGQAVSLSRWVTVRTGEPSQIVVYANALPQPTPAPDVTPPEIRLTRYSGPEYFSYDDQQYRFVVLGNVPDFIRTQFGWKPGDKLFLKPKKNDDGWLDKVGDAVGSVFSGFKDLVNFLSKTWDDLKTRLINTVCFDNADCAKVAMPVLNTGLTYIGIPPELPNFNALTSMGADYLACYVASQTGLPGDGVRMGLEKMGDLVNNPPGGSGSFLWPDPDYQDTPAVIWIEVYNPLSVPTDPVVLTLRYGSPGGDAYHAAPKLATFLDTQTPIPPLRPGQRMEIPVFLTENPEIGISHGADRKSDYYDRPIIIYDAGGKVRFSSSGKWYHHDVINSH